MANFIPIHKTKLKEILSTIIWNETTFAQKEVEGKNHILKYLTFNVKYSPTILIFHTAKATKPIDTAYNLETNTYIIRIMTDNISEIGQDKTEELASLVFDKLVDNYAKTNEFWENMTNIKMIEYKGTETLFYRDITLDLINTQTRTIQTT